MMSSASLSPFDDPRDPAYRPPVDPRLPFPPQGRVDHPHLKELLYSHLDERHTVVDVGCGPGPFEYSHFRPRFIAFDAFDLATREGLVEGRDEFRKGRLETIPLDDASCAAVILGFILEHVTDPLAFLREADRVLCPGGWVYVAIPNARSLEDRLFRLATRVAGSRRGPHIQRFTLETFQDLVEGHTRLRLVAWHALRAGFLWMNHPRLRLFRKPLVGALRSLRFVGYDAFREANYQFLLQKP